MKKEFYNQSRVIAKFEDEFTGEIIEREINFCTFPFSTKEKAESKTIENIKMWINERGNKQHNTILKYISHEAV